MIKLFYCAKCKKTTRHLRVWDNWVCLECL